jgi:AraC-like DNA-binding protein
MHLAVDFVFSQNFKQQFHTEAIGRHVHLSASRVRHLFQEQLGLSPAQLFKWRQMQAAKELLETTLLSVKEIMHEVGLSDISHFVRDFKSWYGLTPSQLRRQAGSQQP